MVAAVVCFGEAATPATMAITMNRLEPIIMNLAMVLNMVGVCPVGRVGRWLARKPVDDVDLTVRCGQQGALAVGVGGGVGVLGPAHSVCTESVAFGLVGREPVGDSLCPRAA